MNLPNKLTMSRIFLVPVMIALYLLKSVLGDWSYLLMGVIFVIASLTDYFDGKIARKRNIVTTFGKFIDPLADKLLVMAAIIILADNYRFEPSMWMPFWIPIIILAREFIVTSIRLVAVGEGKIIAASNLGKYKTAFTMLTVTYYMFVLPFTGQVFTIIGIVLVCGSALLTMVSGIDYFIKNRKIITESI